MRLPSIPDTDFEQAGGAAASRAMPGRCLVRERDGAAPRRPVRVAIVGGGCAGVAAAWHLSRQPGYEVHVYERRWRLGGKGASVRDKDGRIRDHGLHIWLGFYENAFRMARECYAEVRHRGWGPRAKEERDKLSHA